MIIVEVVRISGVGIHSRVVRTARAIFPWLALSVKLIFGPRCLLVLDALQTSVEQVPILLSDRKPDVDTTSEHGQNSGLHFDNLRNT